MSTEPGRLNREVLVTFRETDTERFLPAIPDYSIRVGLDGSVYYKDILLIILSDYQIAGNYPGIEMGHLVPNIPLSKDKLQPVDLLARIKKGIDSIVLTPSETGRQPRIVPVVNPGRKRKKNDGFARAIVHRGDPKDRIYAR